MSRWPRIPHLRQLVLLLVLSLFTVWLYQVAGHGLAAMHIVRARLAWAQQVASGGSAGQLFSQAEFDALDKDLTSLHTNLESLRGDLWPVLPLLRRADRLPLIGADLQAAPYLLDLGVELSAAGQTVLHALRPLLGVIADGNARTRPLGELLVQSLGDAGADLEAAYIHVAAASEARGKIRGRVFLTPVGTYLQRLDRYLPLLDVALRAAQVIPAALGNERPRTYLLLAQNNDELRATGGFISSVGTLTISRGQVTDLSLRDSYGVDDLTVDHPIPPTPLTRYMRIGVLLLRDVNWWPDFPTSAALAMRLWQENQHQTVDGVIAVDLEGMRLLVDGMGPISVEGEARPVDAASLIPLLRERWGNVPVDARQRYEWWLGRKDFVGLLARAAMTKAQTDLSSQNIPHLVRSLKAAIDGKHLLIYAADPAIRPLLADLGADGAVLPTRSDYLMVIDTNMGFNKVNPRIEQHLDYTVDLTAEARPRARLTASYVHKGTVRLAECVQTAGYGRTYEDMMERCYWDYVRVYAPFGSTAILGRASPDLEIGQDGDKATLASFFVLAPGETRTVSFDYLLPADVTERKSDMTSYRLLVQKQAGAGPMPLRVTVILPQGAKLSATEPQAATIEGRTIVFDLLLNQDRTIEVLWTS